MSAAASTNRRTFDVSEVRAEFPALNQLVHGKPLVYLDSAASALKPRAMSAAVQEYYEHGGANIHRAVHKLSQQATAAFERTRVKVQRFLNAPHAEQIIFTHGTTDALNLVASSYGRSVLKPGDEVLLTRLEHHSNIVPWQLICEQTGAKIVVAEINDAGEVTIDEFRSKISPRTKIAAFAHVSNALGTINAVADFVAAARDAGVVTVVDGAQAVPHVEVDVQRLGCDFYAFSAHKLYGPTGVGALYGRRELLDAMPPYQGGGDMILSVTFEGTQYAEVPHKFEAGTPPIASVIGFGAALDFVASLDLTGAHAHEQEVLRYGHDALAAVPGLRLVGTAKNKAAVLSFTMKSAHPHDIGTIVDAEGVAIRTGHHCAQPVMDRFDIAATARASLGIYNTTDDIDALVKALHLVNRMFG